MLWVYAIRQPWELGQGHTDHWVYNGQYRWTHAHGVAIICLSNIVALQQYSIVAALLYAYKMEMMGGLGHGSAL